MNLSIETLPDFFATLMLVFALACSALWTLWVLQMGVLRGTLATLCRVGWLAPLFVSFFPESVPEPLPRALSLTPLHVLIDDSSSMKSKSGDSDAPYVVVEQLRQQLENDCARLGCLPKLTLMSSQDKNSVEQGYTPLAATLESWLYKVGSDPWLLISDGGDAQPTEPWSSTLKGLGLPLPGREAPRGLIVGFASRRPENIWIQAADVAPFSFDDKSITARIALSRSEGARDRYGSQRIQVQVLTGGAPIATVNAEFKAADLETNVGAVIPPLPRGQHLLTMRALPTPDEAALWDNDALAQVEVMPNTVGVLHLLGSPSWDGRFLRRYLKSEPKYDLISFFILRDPWDSQQVNERELSLIPFPVERLFREELSNFRVVVIQNFTLFQFLLAEYQTNLVDFVKGGGGLLFIGGPRALRSADLSSSPLREILPFEVDAPALSGASLPLALDEDLQDDLLGGSRANRAIDDPGAPSYDADLAFSVELAKPDLAKRALANVYDEWENLAESMASWKTAKGLHHMERVQFKDESTTPLLVAKAGNTTIPLAVASYPGKGRAIWLFSDAFWRLGMTVSEDASRQVYNRFLQAAMTWLMRQDLKKPLVIKNFSLQGGRSPIQRWQATLQGPAVRYFQPTDGWHVSICGAAVAGDQLVVSKRGAEEWEISGPLIAKLAGGERCTLNLEGTHPAFGSVKASMTSVSPQIFRDEDIDAAPQKLLSLAELTGARVALPPTSASEALREWLETVTATEGIALPSRFKTLRNFYWILERPWFWALLLLLPLEVVIRRWEQLFGVRHLS